MGQKYGDYSLNCLRKEQRLNLMLPDTLVGTEVPNLIFRRTESHALKSQSGLKISNSNWKDLEEVVVPDAGSFGHVDPCLLQLEF